MENNSGTPQDTGSHVRQWIDPTRIYNPTIPAGRLVFLWGLAIYPGVVIFALLTVAIIIMEAAIPRANVGDDIGIVTWIFMLGWVIALVSICRRRLLQLGKSSRWVWLAILPIANLPLLLYLLFKSAPVESHHAIES